MKKYILLMLFCLLSKSAITQVQTDYFPLEVGDEWTYRTFNAQNGFFSDGYAAFFNVTGKEVINDTTYYVVKCRLFPIFQDISYYRKDSSGNVFIRYKNLDQLFIKFDAQYGDNWKLQTGGGWTMIDNHSDYGIPTAFGNINKKKKYLNPYLENKYGTEFADGYGCTLSRVSDAFIILKRAVHNGIIITPQVTCINSIYYNDEHRKILLKSYAVMDTTTQIILESKKQGHFKGSLLRFKPSSDFDRINGPNYAIESGINYSLEGDTIKIIVPAIVADILGDKVDGNGNQIWEGSPIDDYTATIIIPSLPNKVDIPGTIPNYKLNQNYPNSFNPSTKISFSISESGFVKLVVYDLLGREIKNLVSENRKPGNYEVNFDASGFPSGSYFYKLQVNNFIESKKMFLLK